MRAGRVTAAGDERARIYADIQQILADDVPYIPLYNTKNVVASQASVHGLTRGSTAASCSRTPGCSSRTAVGEGRQSAHALVRTSSLAAIPVAAGVVVCVFLLLRIVPGDPAQMILGDQATTASIEALRARLGLEAPIGQQLLAYLAGVFTRADIGTSLVTDQSVLGLIGTRAPLTALLVALAVGFTVLIAVPLAVLAATGKDGPLDHIVRVFPTIGMAMLLSGWGWC